MSGILLKPVKKFLELQPRRHFIQVFKGITNAAIKDLKLQESEAEQAAWVSKKQLKHSFISSPELYVPSMAVLLQLFIVD